MAEPERAPRRLHVAPSGGLSSREAEARLRRGEGNRVVSASSRSYTQILRTNVLNLYNSILFVIGAALLALDRCSDAVISVSIRLLNAVISAVQEIRASASSIGCSSWVAAQLSSSATDLQRNQPDHVFLDLRQWLDSRIRAASP